MRCAAPQSRCRTGGPVTVCRGCARWHARRAVECGRAAGSEGLVHHAHGVVVVVVESDSQESEARGNVHGSRAGRPMDSPVKCVLLGMRDRW